ncbi:MAG: primosomal protein N' [Bacillota bacterium]|nr:primosomal protein N' [Bacillota bacterium]
MNPGAGEAPRTAAVAVDIAAAATDRLFDYWIPPEWIGRLRPGWRVRVPFGRSWREGFVIELRREPSVPPERVRPIAAVLDPVPALTPEALELARWCAHAYGTTLVQALRVMLPAGLRGDRIRRRTEEMLAPGPAFPSPEQEAEHAAAPARRRVLELLRRSPGPWRRRELERAAGVSAATLRAMVRAGLLAVERRALERSPWSEPAEADRRPPLTPAQERAVQAVREAVESGSPAVFLLQGVTGSGKTEVYLRALEAVLAAGRQAIVLVPEIALTPQTVARFRARFGDRVAVFHSGLGDGERYDEWWRVRRGEADLVVGARSAVFAPCRRLGLIVVDEEQEASYKQEETPRYHARSVALERARRAGCPVLLGSATPALESLAEAQRGRYRLLRLPERVGGRPLPAAEAVDMRRELAEGNRSLFSRRLAEALDEVLARREQAVLLLNRRGFHTFVLCRECGHVLRCPKCAVSLAYHADQALLRCHYCGWAERPPSRCPACGGSALGYHGSGTQRVEEELARRWPAARVLRMDADSTVRKGSHEAIYRRFLRGEADVLVGTQMVAKGWDVGGVTLVGVVNADTALNLPDFRAAERTFQLLTQAAGRAGRGERPGRVLIQSYAPEHYAIQAALRMDPEAFARVELPIRRELGYPPFRRLVRLLVLASSPEEAERVARAAAGELARRLPAGARLVGPSEAPLGRLKGQARWHLLLSGERVGPLRDAALEAAARAGREAAGARLAVDVDPLSLL